MKQALREYRRIKRAARIMEGNLDESVILCFLEHVDQDVLSELRVSKADQKNMNRSKPENRLKILVPYFERALDRMVMDRHSEKLRMADRIAGTINDQTKHKLKKIVLPYQSLLMLTQLNPAPYISLENGTAAFTYETPRLKQVMMGMAEAKIVWDPRINQVRALVKERRSRSMLTLVSQDPYDLMDKPVYTVSISTSEPSFSLTELVLKAVESLLG